MRLLANGCSVRVITSGSSHFFGFHDLTPWDPSDQYLTVLRTETPESRLPGPDDVADVLVIEEDSGTIHRVATTHAWNWQQGARQQWLPDSTQPTLIYNDATPRGYTAYVHALGQASRRSIDSPVYDIAPWGSLGLGVDFQRLRSLSPGYGYGRFPVRPSDHRGDGGIHAVDISTVERTQVVRLSDVLRLVEMREDAGAHYLTHPKFAPDGAHFCFLHRCIHESGMVTTHLVVTNADGQGARVLGSDKVSHFAWKDARTIVAWCRKNQVTRRLKTLVPARLGRALIFLSRKLRSNRVRQAIYAERFVSFDIHSGVATRFGTDVLQQDGHPQPHPLYDWLWVSDTYPTPDGTQLLYLFDHRHNQMHHVAAFPTNRHITGTDWRCDLHPRWSRTGTRISVDSVSGDRRQLVVVDVRRLVNRIVSGSLSARDPVSG